ncbi:MAG: LptF/LptG family permease [Verrucomicrobiae bacterium]|nr:LptF/LptG family permease [Verrucomicrobiae bacterium]
MKTLHIYLLRQVIPGMLLAVAVFTFILLLGNVLREVLLLLVSQRVTLAAVLRAVALLVPFALVFALPMGMLTATLLVFGRLSADHELTAVRASGISLSSLITPVMLLSVVVSALSGWFSLHLGPTSRFAYKELIYNLGLERPASLLSENQFVKDFPGFVIYVGGVIGTNTLRNVLLYKMETGKPLDTGGGDTNAPGEPALARVSMILWAHEARIVPNPTNQTIQLVMTKVEGVFTDSWQPGGAEDQVIDLPMPAQERGRKRAKLTEMTFFELLTEYYDWRRRGVDPTPVAVQINRQVAFSFAPVSFTLLAIPLGIRAHRRETSAGVGISIILLLVYYGFIVVAQAWETKADRHPELLPWVPNLLFQFTGSFLLWRANNRV